MALSATKPDIVVNEELRSLIPPLTDEECAALRSGKLGFEGFSKDDCRRVMLIPTSLSPNYWIWVVQDAQLGIEEYSRQATAGSRIPWGRFRDVDLVAVPMAPMREYPSPDTSGPRIRKPKHLYVLQSAIGGPVKIGVSGCPDARATQLHTGSPFPLRVIRVYHEKGGFESAVHDAFRDWKLHGEWFDPSVIEAVDRLVEQGG